MAVSIVTPLIYVVIVLSSLVAFSSFHRRRRFSTRANLEPWYNENVPRDLFESLQVAQVEGRKVPPSLKKAALIQWAAEDIRQLIRMKDCKPVLESLHQRGSVGEDVWIRFTASEKAVNADVMAIQGHAEALQKGWAGQLFASASEVAQSDALRKRMLEFPAQQQEYKQAWDAIRKASLEELQS